MATLVLTTVGTILGGPIGGAIGALAGQAIDAQIFKPAGREGPRMTDLRVQTSTYGTQIPRLYGQMRVAGTVIWATDLQESSQTSGGKGQPSVTTYSYSASFAVALSSRPIMSVGRIWADGNLLRGAAGDFKSAVAAYRVHEGGADQPADPLILGDRGAAMTPACRDMAYVVFEGLQLADFGNRIPSLTFEIVADAAAVPVEVLCADLTDGTVAYVGDAGPPALDGYAAAGDTAGEAVQPLLDCHDLLLRAGGIALGAPSDAILRIADDLRASNDNAQSPREEARAAVETAPRRVALRYYDPARDYQAGVQSADRQGAGQTEAQIELPATMVATTAQQCASTALRRRFLARRTMTLSRGWRALALTPGDYLAVEGAGGAWRVETLEWDAMAVRLALKAVPTISVSAPAAADPGGSAAQPDRLLGPTHLALVETPQLFDTLVSTPQVFAAACGEGAAWRSASLLLQRAEGGFDPIGAIRRPSVVGSTVTALGPGPATLIDLVSVLDVTLYDASAILAGVTDAALLNGANACMVGRELLQFGTAEQSGPRRYRLGRLLRGRRGTEAWIAGHGAGEPFVLLSEDALYPLPQVDLAIGRTVMLAAQGVGDTTPAEASEAVAGMAMLPPSPVHLRVSGDASMGLDIGWTRRSRLGWQWADGGDAPLAEEREAYLVEIGAGARLLRSEQVSGPAWTYAATTLATDIAAAASEPLRIAVRQSGTFGLSDPLTAPLGI